MKSIFKKIFAISVVSFIVCFFSALVLMIGNKIMGVNIGASYYFLLASVCFLMLLSGIILTNTKYVFKKKKKPAKKVKQKANQNTSSNSKHVQRKKRKIS